MGPKRAAVLTAGILTLKTKKNLAKWSPKSFKDEIGDWHPGKIVIIWVVYAILWQFLGSIGDDYFLGSTGDDQERIVMWGILAIPGVVVTWMWFTARKKKPPPDE